MKELLHRDGTPMRKYSSPLINELNRETMNSKINEVLSRLDDTIFGIDVRVKAINDKLDELIAALHNYDDGLEMFDNEPKSHYVTNEEADEDAFNDYGQKVVMSATPKSEPWVVSEYKDKMGWLDENNNPANKNVSEKKRSKRKYYKPKQPKTK